MEQFIAWTDDELKKRGWSKNELSKQMNLSSSAVSTVLSGQRQPTWEFCAKLGKALNRSPIYIFRLAQLLPPTPDDQREEERMLYFFRQVSADCRTLVIGMLRGLVQTLAPTMKEIKVLEAFRSLRHHERETIAQMINALAKGQSEQKDE